MPKQTTRTCNKCKQIFPTSAVVTRHDYEKICYCLDCNSKMNPPLTYFKNDYIDCGDYIKIVMRNDKSALIDKQDYELVRQYQWQATLAGRRKDIVYVQAAGPRIKGRNRNILMHRLIMNPTSGEMIDHISHDATDNRRCNLRICNRSQNAMNARIQPNNKSGHTGVCYRVRNNKWHASIIIGGKDIYLGGYYNKQDAINARKKAEELYFGEFAYNHVEL